MEVIETWERPNSVEKTEKRLEIDKLRNALQSIAGEIQKFQESSVKEAPSAVVSKVCSEKEKDFAELVDCKIKIKSKRARIHKLKKNLKTACFVVKTIASAKDDQSKSLNQHLNYAQSECFDLLERYKNNTQIINRMSRENQMLHNKLNNMENFISLGYTELQKMRQHESADESSVLAQLKQLIFCCGEYYAESCNEHDVCMQLKQKNNFLLKKIQILENNVADLSEQLKTLKYRNCKLQKENDLVKDRCTKAKAVITGVECSEVNTRVTENPDRSEITYRTEFCSQWDFECDFDLLPHLSLVKKLLSDQDALLKDLRIISQEFKSSSHDPSPF